MLKSTRVEIYFGLQPPIFKISFFVYLQEQKFTSVFSLIADGAIRGGSTRVEIYFGLQPFVRDYIRSLIYKSRNLLRSLATYSPHHYSQIYKSRNLLRSLANTQACSLISIYKSRNLLRSLAMSIRQAMLNDLQEQKFTSVFSLWKAMLSKH